MHNQWLAPAVSSRARSLACGFVVRCTTNILYAQTTPPVTFSEAEKKVMTERIQNAGTVVVEAKAGKVRRTQAHTAVHRSRL